MEQLERLELQILQQFSIIVYTPSEALVFCERGAVSQFPSSARRVGTIAERDPPEILMRDVEPKGGLMNIGISRCNARG